HIVWPKKLNDLPTPALREVLAAVLAHVGEDPLTFQAPSPCNTAAPTRNPPTAPTVISTAAPAHVPTAAPELDGSASPTAIPQASPRAQSTPAAQKENYSLLSSDSSSFSSPPVNPTRFSLTPDGPATKKRKRKEGRKSAKKQKRTATNRIIKPREPYTPSSYE
ncbi:hypothetical protein Bbelb_406160, partial [Branchiostoma belcheri]